MKLPRMLALLFSLFMVLGIASKTLRADEWDKATKITFKDAVQVPGKVLQPGTYYFKLLDSQANRHIVQIFNEDHTALITTVLAIPNYRLQPTGKTVLTYDERPADEPVALAAWFYPGDNFGQEFAYPKSKADQLSRLNKHDVPSTGSDETYSAKSEEKTPNTEPNAVSAQTTPPAQQTAPSQSAETAPSQPMTESPRSETQPSAAPEQAPTTRSEPVPTMDDSSNAARSNTQRTQLPQTASLLPLVGLVAIAFLGVALLLRLALRP